MNNLVALIVCLAASAMLAGKESAAPPFESVETKDLHNAHRISDKLVSGAAPETEQAFKDLQALGIKTILTVDGAQPDVETAKRYGMRYVHLPIGYDGVEREEGKRIAKALAELPGPIYLHCHHGKHRSAAAVAVACVMNGQLKPEQAESVLKTFGTGVNYLGLWKAGREARPLGEKELAETKVEYVERAKIPELAKQMVAIDGHNDHLKAIEKAGWTSPPDHPDLDPAHEALQLEEHLRETSRTEDTKARPAEYRKQLSDAEAAAGALREALGAKPVVAKAAAAAFKTLGTSCTSCHKSFRD